MNRLQIATYVLCMCVAILTALVLNLAVIEIRKWHTDRALCEHYVEGMRRTSGDLSEEGLHLHRLYIMHASIYCR